MLPCNIRSWLFLSLLNRIQLACTSGGIHTALPRLRKAPATPEFFYALEHCLVALFLLRHSLAFSTGLPKFQGASSGGIEFIWALRKNKRILLSL
ncbi:MAG: hypothetical protein ACYYK0_01010 [Candidatus Eutrophobiaceae bacterium]